MPIKFKVLVSESATSQSKVAIIKIISSMVLDIKSDLETSSTRVNSKMDYSMAKEHYLIGKQKLDQRELSSMVNHFKVRSKLLLLLKIYKLSVKGFFNIQTNFSSVDTYLEYVNPLDKTTTNNLSIKNYTRTFSTETPIPTPEPIVSYTIDQKELSKKAKSKPTTPQKPSTINFDIDLNDFSLDVQDLALTMDKSPENIEKALEISRKCIDYLQNKLQSHRSMPRSQRSCLDSQGKPAFEQPFSRAFSIAVKPNILTAAPQRTKSRDSTPSVVTLTFQDNQNAPKLSFHLNNSNNAGKQSTKRSRSRKETRERYSHADSGKLETFAKDSQDLNQQGDLILQNIDADTELKEALAGDSKKPTPIITSEIAPVSTPHLLVSKISPTNLLHEKVSAKLSSGNFANFAPKTSSRASIPTESDLVEYNLTTARGGISARSPQAALFSDRQPTSASKEINLPVTTKPWTPRTLSIELIPESADENSKIAPTPMNHRKSDQFSVNSSIMKRKSTFEKLEQSISSTKANTFVSIKDIPSAGLVQSPTGALTLRASKTPLTDRPKLNSLDEVNPQNSLVAAPALTSDQEINALLGKVLQPSNSAINLYSGKSSSEQPKSSRIIRTKGTFQGLGLNEIKYSMEPKNSERKMFPLARMLSPQTSSYKENNPGFSSKLTSPKSYLEGKSLEKKLNKSNAETKHSYRSSLQTDRPSSSVSTKTGERSSKRTNQPNGTPITSPKAFETSSFKQTLNLKGIKVFEHQLPDRGTKTSRANTPKTANKNTPAPTVAAQQAQTRRLSLPKNTSQVAHHLRRNSSNLCLNENTPNFALDLPKMKNHRYSDVSPHKTINSLCSPRTPHVGKPLSTRRVSIHENEEGADSYYPVKKTCEHLDASPKFQNLSSPKNSATKEQKPTILIDHKEQEDLDSDTEIIEENYDRTPHPDFLKMMKSVDVEFPPEEKLDASSQQSSGSFQLYDQILKKNFYFQKEKPIKEELLQLNKKYPTLHIREVGESLVDSHESSHDTFIKKYSIGSGLNHLKSPTASSQSDTTKGKSFTSLHKQDYSTTIMKEDVSEIGKATTKPSLQSVEESSHKMLSFLLANNQNHHSTKNLKKPVDLEKQAQSLNEGLRNLFHGKKSSFSALNLLISQNNSIKDKFSTLVTFGGGGTNQSEMTIDGLFADPNDYNVMTSPSNKNVQTLYKQVAPILMKKTYQEQKASYAEHRKDKIKSCTIELQSPTASLETKQLSNNLKLLQTNETKKQNNMRYQEEHREPLQTTINVGPLATVTNKVRPSPLFNSEASEGHDERLGGRGITEEGYEIPDERMDNSNSFIVPVQDLGGKDSALPLDMIRSPIKQKNETDTEDRYSEILTERTPEKLDNGDIVVGPLLGIKKVNF